MSRHLADKARSRPQKGLLRIYTEVEARLGLRPGPRPGAQTAEDLRRRSRGVSPGRAAQFLRIARGRLA
ncbi:hypothetical protein BV394_09385 [Brevirhabdus pacifica]|uniref:Uncharacterized protein n=1 Tax=Brevirhabdus pacifica TaxID=1267768 RepID=A0A1U7DJ17_9RHOB|nr:hypothetical protein [Brevirhabdus pacifica]APX89899.1 hypothetical protein BV394_09385 [Brevirhabdus pacifica]OWU74375.1 hypothetical protein ATO5_14240 [Loktanella sp. 22II-4b]PJJ82874.1 hypothetical protein CLV77_2650 [Brevirhabdus pacifica]